MKTRAPILSLSLAVNLLSFLFVSAAAAAAPWTDAQIKRGVAVFQHHSINLVERDFVPAAADGKISCTLAKGEYEPVQIAVRALAPGGIKNVRLAVESDFDVRIFRRIDGEVVLGPHVLHSQFFDDIATLDPLGDIVVHPRPTLLVQGAADTAVQPGTNRAGERAGTGTDAGCCRPDHGDGSRGATG